MKLYESIDWREPLAGFDPWRNAPDDCRFYPKRAAQYCEFLETHIKLSRGDGYMGHYIELMPWQTKFIGWLFGWLCRNPDGRFVRRFDTAFVYIPKKNGKSEFTSAIASTLFLADPESDKKIYCAANVKEQAALVFNAANYQVQNSGIDTTLLKGTRDISRKRIIYTPSNSLLTAISRDARNTEGVEPSVAVIDELHVFPDGQLLDVLRKGMITRREPLFIMLTTAAHQGDNICNNELDYARRVRDGQLNNPKYLPVIFEPGPNDDWKDERTWFKVNPGLGHTIRIDRFRDEFAKALENPRAELEFKRLNLNLQGKDSDQWVDLEDWKACPSDISPADLEGQPCTMGLDLSATRDLTALCLYFPRQRAFLPYFFVPQQTAAQRDDYQIWAKDGLLQIAGGAAIAEDEIRRKIQELAGGWDEQRKQRIKGRYDVRAIAFDPWRMAALSNTLTNVDELNLVKFRQGYITMAEPTARLEGEIADHQITHFNNPILTWMITNAVAKVDPRGNTMLVKDNPASKKKIDGLIAMIMARGVYEFPDVKPLFEESDVRIRFLEGGFGT